MSGFTLVMGSREIIVSGIVQGFGLGFIFVPLQALAFASLAPSYRTTGASLLNLSRNIGGSVGISVVTSLLARNLQVSHSDLAAHVTPSTLPLIDPSVIQRFGQLSDSAVGDAQPRDQPPGADDRLSRRFPRDDAAHPGGAAARLAASKAEERVRRAACDRRLS